MAAWVNRQTVFIIEKRSMAGQAPRGRVHRTAVARIAGGRLDRNAFHTLSGRRAGQPQAAGPTVTSFLVMRPICDGKRSRDLL